jgi:diguanylate cyclase (GGDEF)-like protein
MKNRKPITAFAPHEISRFIAAPALAIIVVMAIIILDGALADPINPYLVIYGIFGIIHTALYTRLIARPLAYRKRYSIRFSITTGIALGLLVYILPSHLIEVFHILAVLEILAVTAGSGRLGAIIVMGLAFSVSIPQTISDLTNIRTTLEYLEPFIVAVIVMETYARIKRITQQHIHRLETINKASRQLMLTLNKDQMLTLLNATILDTLEAESYFIGILSGDNIRLELMYDDGEFFNGIELPLEGTLSGWVIKNQKELFLPDLREDVQLEGVEVRVIGKEKTSLAWIGVPLKAVNVTGIMVMSSYKPNAFDLADLELLSNLAQHVTLALDNSIRHAQVEEQARLDSLTGVYNHGYFLKKLAEQAETSIATKTPLSLIMLDIDFFKQYNDTYGHLVGDRILNSLCTAIKQHIKQGDAVGRWGGEEFIISLPNATGDQALQVAKRISETMMILRVADRDDKTVPVPTVSQGVAVFPGEADEIYSLIDLADRRLYIAKERGRNQIEPDASHWAT